MVVESVASAAPKRRRFPYVVSLDGIRGLITIPVILFHFSITGDMTTLAPGSFIGPTAFFTLSGFLITSLLMVEKDNDERIDWLGFWRRRFRRLLPASMTVVLVAVAAPKVVERVWGEVRTVEALAAIFSFKNWQDIHYASNAETGMRTLGPLSPFWSLSIEEQFYLGMTIVIGLAMFSVHWRRWLAAAFVVVGAYSVWSMITIESTLNREFFGTDTRAAELVVGCLLALAIDRWGWPSSPRWSWVGWASLLGTLWFWSTVTEHDRWVLRGGLSAMSLLTVGLILGAAPGTGWFATAFSWPPLVELGKMSYAVYVSHWPVALALRPDNVGFGGWPLLGIRILASFAVAFALTRWIETPIRTRARLQGAQGPIAFVIVLTAIVVLTRL